MSTPSSPSTQFTGKCVVCGKETAKKCSACAMNGTDWMFFCSTDHQKLIWSVHKRVCGERSHPFQIPPLTQKEVDDILVLSEQPYMAGGRRTTWLEIFTAPNTTLKTQEERYAWFKMQIESAKENKGGDPQLPTATPVLLIWLRNEAHMSRRAARSLALWTQDYNTNLSEAVAEHPLDFWGWMTSQTGLIRLWKGSSVTISEGLSEVAHRQLIVVAIIARGHRNLELAADLGEFLSYASQELRKSLEKHIEPNYPDIAAKFYEAILDQIP